MSQSWRQLGGVAPDELGETRITLHHAAQLVAAVGDSLLAVRPDSSQKSMIYLPEKQALAGQPNPGKRPFRMALVVPRLSLELICEDIEHPPRFPLAGRTNAEAIAWINEVVRACDKNAGEVSLQAYPEDFPRHAVAEGAPFPAPEPGHLMELDRYFSNAWRLLTQVRQYEDGARPLLVWPHHFDFAFLIRVAATTSEEERTVGVGFCAGDGVIPEPYGYVSPWPHPPASTLPSDDPPGTWQAEPWYGAVLRASDVFRAGGDQEQTVLSFTVRAVEVARSLLIS